MTCQLRDSTEVYLKIFIDWMGFIPKANCTLQNAAVIMKSGVPLQKPPRRKRQIIWSEKQSIEFSGPCLLPENSRIPL